MPLYKPNPSKVIVYKDEPTVYVLVNFETYKLYIGYTHNLKRRLSEHYGEKCITSRSLGDPKLLVCMRYINVESEAAGLKLERQLQIAVRLGWLRYNNLDKFSISKLNKRLANKTIRKTKERL